MSLMLLLVLLLLIPVFDDRQPKMQQKVIWPTLADPSTREPNMQDAFATGGDAHKPYPSNLKHPSAQVSQP